MFTMLQTFTAVAQLDPMNKMWVSFIGMGLMILAAAVVLFARSKTKGWIRIILVVVAVVLLIYGCLCELIALT
ncbi:DUF2768 family protein [Cohnella endophytica]|nr:DUF2768 family protein [Cohnella endophytica]